MYKLLFVCLALIAVASAQYLASPYAYSGLYRSGYVGAYPSVYSSGYYGAPAVVGAYPTAYSGAAYLYK